MKINFIILLLSNIFCVEIFNQKDYYNLNSFIDKDIKYLDIDISKYKKNDVIHICVTVYDGKMNKKIYYDFFDEIPDEPTSLQYLKGTSGTDTICYEEVYPTTCKNEYYYDIKVLRKAKYIRIKISGYNGSGIICEKKII